MEGLSDDFDRDFSADCDGFSFPDPSLHSTASGRSARQAEFTKETAGAAADSTGKAIPTAAVGIDVERRMMVVVEGTQIVGFSVGQVDPGPGPCFLKLCSLLRCSNRALLFYVLSPFARPFRQVAHPSR